MFAGKEAKYHIKKRKVQYLYEICAIFIRTIVSDLTSLFGGVLR